MFILDSIVCGDGMVTMDRMIPDIFSLVVTLIKIGVPVLLIIFGMLDLGKAVMAQKEDEIKKSQQLFLKRLLSAALVFFVVMIVQVVFNLVAKKEEKIWECISCFVNGLSSEADSAYDPDGDAEIPCR
mgnify:CR=1 FL=1